MELGNPGLRIAYGSTSVPWHRRLRDWTHWRYRILKRRYAQKFGNRRG